MHATLDREAGAGADALFFADLPDSQEKPAAQPVFERSAYGANRNPNWTMIIAIVALHVVTLYALVKFDVIHIAEKKKPLVVELIAEPPVPPAEKQKPEPVVVEKVQPVVVTPPPIVQTNLTPPPQITVTTTPPPPKMVAPVAPPPTGPVTVGNLDERMIDGNPPRYPMESRRKREQGTVQLRLLIGTDGRVAQVSIAQSSGFERLDQAALQAARSWRWQPMVRDGAAVEVRGIMAIPFVLAG
jgi:protein TonB